MKKVSTSNFVDKTTVASGKVPYDINIRTILTFREIGNGHTAIETFCGLMNMPPPMTVNTYHETIANMHPVYIESAEHSMKATADEIHKDVLGDDYTEEAVVDIDNSTDGSWQKRGFTSLNGLIIIRRRLVNA